MRLLKGDVMLQALLRYQSEVHLLPLDCGLIARQGSKRTIKFGHEG